MSALAHATTLAGTATLVPLRPHSFRVDNAAYDDYAPEMGAIAFALYCALSRYANRQTGVCWPSITTLATKLKLGRNTVKKYLRVLVKRGLISWQPRWDEAGDQASHLYTVHPCPAPRQAVPPLPAGGRSVADSPSVHLHGGGESAAAPEQEREQAQKTSAPIFLSALKKTPPPRLRDADKVVQITLENLTHDFTAVVQHREEVAARQVEVQALEPATYRRLEAAATARIYSDPAVNPRYVPRVQIELLMYDLYQAELLAEAGQLVGREGPPHREEAR